MDCYLNIIAYFLLRGDIHIFQLITHQNNNNNYQSVPFYSDSSPKIPNKFIVYIHTTYISPCEFFKTVKHNICTFPCSKSITIM